MMLIMVDENIEAVRKLILDSIRITVKQVADNVGSCQTILMDVLAIKHAAAKIVPKLLNF